MHRYEPDPSLLEDTARNIASNNKYYPADMVLDAVKSYKLVQVDFFTMAGLINHTNEKISHIALKQAEMKRKEKEEELRKQIEQVRTPEEERKIEELIAKYKKELKEIISKKGVFKGFPRPFEKDKDYEKFKKSL